MGAALGVSEQSRIEIAFHPGSLLVGLDTDCAAATGDVALPPALASSLAPLLDQRALRSNRAMLGGRRSQGGPTRIERKFVATVTPAEGIVAS